MQLRRLVTWAAGAGVGAGAMYLLDPDRGEVRRAEARRSALRQVRRGVRQAARQAVVQARVAGEAAVTGYREARGS